MDSPFSTYTLREYRWRREILRFDDPEGHFKTGRGVAYGSSKWKLPKGMWEPADLSGSEVVLCGRRVKVIGVEAFASNRTPDFPYQHSFCLLISFEDAKALGWEEK